MKRQLACMMVATAVLVAMPTMSRAEDKPAAAAAEQTAPAVKKHTPFNNGKVTAVDATASTVTVDRLGVKLVLQVTSETKIIKDGKPATLADIKAGEKIGGAYKKTGETLTASLLRIGERVKPEKIKKPTE